MQNVNNLNLLNKKPVLVISHEGLEAIKHIVNLAPQEAQWFHTLTPIYYEHAPDEIFLKLSTKLYIPKQNTSVAQVDSTSAMMIDFYNELKAEYQDQAIVNQKLSSMTCWCHSHHTMSPNPSNQDDLQFNSFINLAEDQQSQAWQVMLIFNKKDQFYSRAWDPSTGLIYEGIDIVIQNEYDFSYIDTAAKQKFIKRTFSFDKRKNGNFTARHWFDYKKSNYNYNLYDDEPSQNLFFNEEIALEIISEIFKVNKKEDIFSFPKVYFNQDVISEFWESLCNRFNEKELEWFLHLLKNDSKNVLKTFTDYGYEKYGSSHSEQFVIFSKLLETQVSLKEIYNNCLTVLDLADCQTKKEAQELLEPTYTRLK